MHQRARPVSMPHHHSSSQVASGVDAAQFWREAERAVRRLRWAKRALRIVAGITAALAFLLLFGLPRSVFTFGLWEEQQAYKVLRAVAESQRSHHYRNGRYSDILAELGAPLENAVFDVALHTAADAQSFEAFAIGRDGSVLDGQVVRLSETWSDEQAPKPYPRASLPFSLVPNWPRYTAPAPHRSASFLHSMYLIGGVLFDSGWDEPHPDATR